MDGISPSPAFTGRLQPVFWTILGPLVCGAIAVGLNRYLFSGMDPHAYDLALMSAVILPFGLGVPVFFFFRSRCANFRSPITACGLWQRRTG